MTFFMFPLILLGIGVVAMVVLWIFLQRGKKSGSDRTPNNPEKVTRRKQSREEKQARAEIDSQRLQYRFDHGSVFIYGRSVWCGLKLQGISDGYLQQERLDGYATAASRALSSLSDGEEDVEVHVRLTHRPISARTWHENLMKHVWNPSLLYQRYTARVRDGLQDSRVTTPTVMMFVKIDQLDSGAAADLLDRTNAALMGGADDFVAPDMVAEWEMKAAAVLDRVSGLGCPIVPTDREDRMWVIRKTLSGHLIPDMTDFPRTKAWGAGQFMLWVDFHADNSHRNYIVIETDNTSVARTDQIVGADKLYSYTACLCVAEWPEEYDLGARQAWLRWFASRPEYPEVAYRFTLTPAAKFNAKMMKARDNLMSEIEDRAKATALPDNVMNEDYFLARDVVDSHSLSPHPGTVGQIVIQVSADSEAELTRRCNALILAAKRELGDQVTLVRPRRYQYRLLQSMLPGSDERIVAAPYFRMSDPSMFGAGLPNGGSQVGDREEVTRGGQKVGWQGDYIGHENGIPVFFSPMVGPARNNGGGLACLGASGFGKSNLAMLITFLSSEAGVRTKILDPKVDFAQFFYYMAFGPQVNDPGFEAEAASGILGTAKSKFKPVNQAFWDDTEIIDVIRSAPGAFDPWLVEKDVMAGELLAIDLLNMFLGDEVWDRFQLQALGALGDVTKECEREGVRPSMYRVAQYIIDRGNVARATAREENRAMAQHEEQWSNLASQMERLRNVRYSSLVFAENPHKMVEDTTKRRVVYTLRGMAIPPTGAKRTTMEQRFALTIMYLITRVAAQALDQAKEKSPWTGEYGYPPKLLVIDEANMVVGNEAGAQMVKESFGKGRSYNAATLVIDQQAARIAAIEEGEQSSGEVTGNQISTVFGFAQKTEGEAKNMLPLFGRDPKREEDMPFSVSLRPAPAGDLTTGVAMMRDVDGAIARVEIDLLFKELLRGMDTNPTTKAHSQAFPLDPDPRNWTWLGQEDRQAAVSAAQVLTDQPDNTDDDVAVDDE